MEKTMRSFRFASSFRAASDFNPTSVDLVPHSAGVATAAELGSSPFHPPDMNGTDGDDASPEFVDLSSKLIVGMEGLQDKT